MNTNDIEILSLVDPLLNFEMLTESCLRLGSRPSLCGSVFPEFSFSVFCPEAVALWLAGVEVKGRVRQPYEFSCVGC